MRQSSPLFFLLLILLLAFAFHTAAMASRVLREDEITVRPEEIKYELPVEEVLEFPWHNLVGTEGCKDGNEECLDRRVMYEEAHLDYIYTQHRPKP